MHNPLKIIFFGTPDFAVPFLKLLLTDKNFLVTGVVTQPDKPTGRKQILSPSPVKIFAQENKLPVLQPTDLKTDKGFIAELKKLAPDFLLVVAFGQILPPAILDLAQHGNINVHPSLLPQYRGASPVQAAILNGEEKIGISIILMDKKMDHGPILAQTEIKLTGEETNESLHQRLAEIGAPLLLKTTLAFWQKEIAPQPQDDGAATFCQTVKKEEAKINWQETAIEIERKVRAFYPWPATWANFGDKRLKIFPPVKIIKAEKKPGEIFVREKQLAVGCGQDALLLSTLQLEGKTIIKAADFLRGRPAAGSLFLA